MRDVTKCGGGFINMVEINLYRGTNCMTRCQLLTASLFLLLGLYRVASSFSKYRTVGLRFHYRDDILVCVDSSNGFRLLDVRNRRLAAFHENVELPRVPSGRGHWGGQGDLQPLSGVAFNPGDMLHSMLLFSHRRERVPLL